MEELFAIVFLVTIFLGYGALCAGVGYFAYKNDQSFLLFFILSIIFSPVPVFIFVLILSVATGSLGASDELKEVAKDVQEAKQARHEDDEFDPLTQETVSSGETDGTEPTPLEGGSDERMAQEQAPDARESVEEEPDVSGPEGTDAEVDEPFPWEEEALGEEGETGEVDDEWDDQQEEDDRRLDGEPEAPEGKVRCDVCHSFVDEQESRCPACGNRLE